MPQQAVDLVRETSTSFLFDRFRVGSKLLILVCCWLMVGLFYYSAFFPKDHLWHTVALILVGLSVLAGLHHATSVPPTGQLILNDVIHVVLGALAV